MFADALKIVLNYLFIQASIIAFMLPFYLIYRYKHHQKAGEKMDLGQHLENFFLSKQANYLVFFWAMGEALFWFVIPEFLLLLVVFMRIRRKKELLVYDVAGTVIGTIIAFFTHLSYQTIGKLSYIQPKMIDQTLAWYARRGIWGLIYQPFSGVPYKVFTLTAHDHGFFILSFLIVAVFVRMSRYTIFFGLFVALFPGLHKFVHKHYLRLFFIATFIFSLFLLRIVKIYGPDYKIDSSVAPSSSQSN